ncbi:MAG TPA: hypothetical protein VEL07_06865 [Planctomycetota bacterium]|nr:hypothetical protein [Planctomycetota bacterium]
MTSRRPILLLVAVAPALAAVDASGALSLGSGVRASGLGAFAAIDDDVTALSWNPAGAIQLETPEAAVALGAYDRRSSIAGGEDQHVRGLRVDHAALAVPFHAFGCQQTVGVIWQRQLDFMRAIDYRYAAADSEFDIEVDQDGSYASLGLGYGIEVVPGLGLGITANLWSDDWTGDSRYEQRIAEDELNTLFAARVVTTRTREVRVEHGANAVIGSWWRATTSLAFAGVFRPGFTLDQEIDDHLRQSDDFGPTPDDGTRSSSSVETRYPGSGTLGVAWIIDDHDTIAADATLTRWSQYRTVAGGATRSAVNTNIDPSEFDAGWDIRLGYERVLIFERAVLVARIGALYQELPAAEPVPLDTVDPAAFSATHDRFWGGSLGLSWVTRRMTWDLAAQARHGDDVGAGQDAPADRQADVLLITAQAGVTVFLGE